MILVATKNGRTYKIFPPLLVLLLDSRLTFRIRNTELMLHCFKSFSYSIIRGGMIVLLTCRREQLRRRVTARPRWRSAPYQPATSCRSEIIISVDIIRILVVPVPQHSKLSQLHCRGSGSWIRCLFDPRFRDMFFLDRGYVFSGSGVTDSLVTNVGLKLF